MKAAERAVGMEVVAKAVATEVVMAAAEKVAATGEEATAVATAAGG